MLIQRRPSRLTSAPNLRVQNLGGTLREIGESCPERDIPRYVRLLQAGKLRLDGLIGRRYALDKINAAIDDMRSGAVAGRCVIRFESP